MTTQAGYSSYTDKVFFSFLFLPNLSFLTLLFFYLPTFPLVNFNPPTVFILVKWLKFGFINSCHDNPHRLLYFLLFFYFYFTFTNALFWLSPLLRLISYLFFRSEHVVPGPSSRLETCFPVMLGTSWFTTFVLFKKMGMDVNSYTLQMLTSQFLFSSIQVLRILFLSVSTSIFSLYGFLTIAISQSLQYFVYLFISFYFRLTYYIPKIIKIPDWLISHTSLTNTFTYFLYSLDLSYLWPW